MIDPTDFGRELDGLVRVVRETREKLNVEKAAILAQIKEGHVSRQEGIITLLEMDLSHSNDVMLPVAHATLRAAQLQYNSAVLLTRSVKLARRLEGLTCVLIVLTAVLAVGTARDLIAALHDTPPPTVKFAPPLPPSSGR